MKVVIAEKPSVARDIAEVLGVYNKKDGYLEGNGYAITWAFGHLVGLSTPDAYGLKKWDLESIPFMPSDFKLTLNSACPKSP